jgi:hypothetical protein
MATSTNERLLFFLYFHSNRLYLRSPLIGAAKPRQGAPHSAADAIAIAASGAKIISSEFCSAQTGCELSQTERKTGCFAISSLRQKAPAGVFTSH